MGKTALVVSAHSADFVWRAGGAIALHAGADMATTVVCLSFGERGESAKLWREPGMSLERVKSSRHAEAEKAAEASALRTSSSGISATIRLHWAMTSCSVSPISTAR